MQLCSSYSKASIFEYPTNQSNIYKTLNAGLVISVLCNSHLLIAQVWVRESFCSIVRLRGGWASMHEGWFGLCWRDLLPHGLAAWLSPPSSVQACMVSCQSLLQSHTSTINRASSRDIQGEGRMVREEQKKDTWGREIKGRGCSDNLFVSLLQHALQDISECIEMHSQPHCQNFKETY